MTTVFINEIHYDNTGGDVGEFVEVVAPTGTDLSAYTLVLYNGSGGASYATYTLGSPDSTVDAQDFYQVLTPGIQNGSPDGIALVDAGGVVVQFLSYEGVLTATNGPALGMTSTDIGVSEAGDADLQSLQLTGTGQIDSDFTWTAQSAETPGAVNNGQTFAAPAVAGVTIVQSGGSTDVAEAGATTDTFTVVLDTQPTADVIVTIAGDADATVSPTTLTFTTLNWNATQEVTVTAVDDADSEGPHTATISFTTASADADYNARTVPSLTANVNDDDAPAAANFEITEIYFGLDGEESTADFFEITNTGTASGDTSTLFVTDGTDPTDVDPTEAVQLDSLNLAAGESAIILMAVDAADAAEAIARFREIWGIADSVQIGIADGSPGLGRGADGDGVILLDGNTTGSTVVESAVYTFQPGSNLATLQVATDGTITDSVEGVDGAYQSNAFEQTDPETGGVDGIANNIGSPGLSQGDISPATLSIAAGSAVMAEGDSGATSFTFTVTRSGDASAASSATYTIAGSGSSAANAADFAGLTGTVSFDAGQTTSETITVAVAGDTRVEADELFSVTLSASVGAATLPQPVAFGTIENDDTSVAAPVIANAFINEIHYDNTGTDAGEFIEVVASEGADLSTYSLVLYNGSNGQSYSTIPLTAATRTTALGVDYYVVSYPANGIQNGSPDAVALVNGTTVVQFLGYEGNLTATNGPAMGMTSVDIGVSEDGTEVAGQSLQLSGTGVAPADFTWQAAADDTPGAANNGQGFGEQPGAGVGTLSIAADIDAANEGVTGATTSFTFTVTRTIDEAAGQDLSGFVTVDYTVGGDVNAADFGGTLPSGTVRFAEGETAQTITIEVTGDRALEANEDIVVTLSNPSAGGVIEENGGTATSTITNDDYDAPVASLDITAGDVATITLAGAEISAFDPLSKQFFVTSGTGLQIVDGSDPFGAGLSFVANIDATTIVNPNTGVFFDSTTFSHVQVSNGIVAASLIAADKTQPGSVLFFDSETGDFIDAVTVGANPDMLTFTPDGTKILVANEGELSEDTLAADPAGSVSIISSGFGGLTVQTADFSAFDGQEDALRAAGVRIFEGRSVSLDVEPEYITVAPDGLTAYIVLQEANAVATLDIASGEITAINPLGLKAWQGLLADFSDEDGGIVLDEVAAPVFGLFLPDAIASYQAADGETYYVTANEGDDRDDFIDGGETIRVGDADYVLDPTVYPNAADLKAEDDLGRLNASNAPGLRGDTDGDGDVDQILAYGARSFSIFDTSGNIVYDSADLLERITAEFFPEIFNTDEGNPDDVDSRSDAKGPEPEGITLGTVDGQTYAFVGLERTGGVMVFDVTDPRDVSYVDYFNNPGDAAPEGLVFIAGTNNGSDFPWLAVTNEVSSTLTVYQVDPNDPDLISTIQGDSTTQVDDGFGDPAGSPLRGEFVTVEAIVVGDFQDGDGDEGRNLGGFYLQEELVDQDGNVMTSEGIFVFEGDGDTLGDYAIGDRVRVTGRVDEFFGETQINLSVDGASTALIEAGAVADVNELAVSVDLPSNGTIDVGGTLPQPNLEAYEGMLVTFNEALTITEQFNLDRFNEVRLFDGNDFTQPGGGFATDRPFQFTQYNSPDAAGYQAYIEAIGARSIIYEDGLNTQNSPIGNLDGFEDYTTATAPRMGDQVTGLTGILGYGFDAFRLRTVEEGTTEFVTPEGEGRPSVPADVQGELKVASFNVLNFFTTLDANGADTEIGVEPRGANSAEEFARQLDKTVTAIIGLDADVVGLIEIENDFLSDNGLTAIETLVNAINAELGAGTYAFVDPGAEFVGGDAIANGYIYRTDSVQIAAGTSPSILDDSSVDPALLAQSSIGAIFNGSNTSRAVLAATFEEIATGEEFTVAVNHFKSKGGTGTGSDLDAGDGAGNWNNQRLLAAQALDAWLATNPTGSSSDNQLIIGDLNSYAAEDPIAYLEANGFANLAAEFLDAAYGYLFDGQLGTLDYALANMALFDQVVDVLEWHINADEADALDYNLDFGRDPAYFDGTVPTRASDHDPVLVGLTLDANVELFADATLAARLGRFGEVQAALDAAGTGQAIIVRDAAAIGDAGALTVSDEGLTLIAEAPFNASLTLATGILAVSLGGAASIAVTGNALGNTIVGNAGANALSSLAGNDTLTGGAGDDALDGGAGTDTAIYTGLFSSYTGDDFGQFVTLTAAEGDDRLTGVEILQFSDGTIDLDDGNALFDTLYYYSQNPDVFASGLNALDHYNQFGADEGRDPNAFFDTSGYLAVNADVVGSGFNALEHYQLFGVTEGRDIAVNFDAGVYLAQNPDVAASDLGALEHFLSFGRAEGRAANEAVGEFISDDGFDATYYLLANDDVAASGLGAREHYDSFGNNEDRDTSSVFDTSFYLAQNPDVAASTLDPLMHYDMFGADEGRDPSAEFDTSFYLDSNPDVAASDFNPVTHYLRSGIYEGREINDDVMAA